ncbi:VOC family protein [Streptomyces sp. BR1]|uniref:VOC family protein n=1 Tax=Streptomyces sp. BR1 TaxID=1592323 RepID=UPI00402B0D91
MLGRVGAQSVTNPSLTVLEVPMLLSSHVPGGPTWLDLGVPDVDAAVAFYVGVFGWEFEPSGPEGSCYGYFTLDGKRVAAAGPLTQEGARAAWTVYFRTDDADATVKAVEQAGGTVRFGPYDVFTAGRSAGFTDPAGAEFAVWQPGDHDGFGVADAVGSATWIELYSTDAAAAKEFYAKVFPWRYAPEFALGAHHFTVVRPVGGAADDVHCAIMQLAPENLAAGSGSEWHPYFEVADCDAVMAAASERGATVIVPPVDVPSVGRVAMFLDPAGAVFAVMRSAAR